MKMKDKMLMAAKNLWKQEPAGHESSRSLFDARLSEYANSTCKMNALGDVLDSRGHWWTDDQMHWFLWNLSKKG